MRCPLIASVQASEGSPVDDPETLLKLAQASIREGVRVLRLQGSENIRTITGGLAVPVIGLIKRRYTDSEVYITPTAIEVAEAIEAGSDIVALDATARHRPNGESLADLVRQIHAARRLALADIDSVDSALVAVEAGVDAVSTTLAGYTSEYASVPGPDLELLRLVVVACRAPVLAEGRFAEPWQVDAALRIGATGVVIGGALNDPVKCTRRFMPSLTRCDRVGAVDIGGTWIRYATFSADWKLLEIERAPLMPTAAERLEWIKSRVSASGVQAVGVSTGGIVDPATGEVWQAKPIIPEHAGTVFNQDTLGLPAVALNDGLATAWGHACLKELAGRHVATLALGTGVGCGFVADGGILMGHRGEPSHLNDLAALGGASIEDLLGGAALSATPEARQIADAVSAFRQAKSIIDQMWRPDDTVICGAVGLSDWIKPHLGPGIVVSPFGADAGLYGAAALVLFPPRG